MPFPFLCDHRYCTRKRARCKVLFFCKATPHNSRLTAQAPLRRLRHGICVAKMLANVGLRYPHRASGAKAPRTLRPLPLLRFAVSATGGAHLCSTKYCLRFWLSICRTSRAVSALRIMRYCRNFSAPLLKICGPVDGCVGMGYDESAEFFGKPHCTSAALPPLYQLGQSTGSAAQYRKKEVPYGQSHQLSA